MHQGFAVVSRIFTTLTFENIYNCASLFEYACIPNQFSRIHEKMTRYILRPPHIMNKRWRCRCNIQNVNINKPHKKHRKERKGLISKFFGIVSESTNESNVTKKFLDSPITLPSSSFFILDKQSSSQHIS